MRGRKAFAAHFRGYEDCYTMIGGCAAELLLEEAGLDFRSTKDMDIVVLLDSHNVAEFGVALKSFIKDGGYESQVGSDGTSRLYGFVKPKNASFPQMIELFSWVELDPADDEMRVVRLSADVVASSISAILLDKDYYELLQQSRTIVEGVSILEADALIPFKMRAWLDLTERKRAGRGLVDSKSIDKHRNDVLRLQVLLDPGKTKPVPRSISQDIERFLDKVNINQDVMKSRKIRGSWDEIAKSLKRYYLIS